MPNTTYQQFQQSKVAELERELKAAREEKEALERLLEQLRDIDDIHTEIPKWAHLTPKQTTNVACPVLLLSDLHLDERVNPDEIEGCNEYNREIALKRLKRTLSSTIDISQNYLKGLKFNGAVLMLGGDTFSGSIHEELEQTNEDTIPGSLEYWLGPLAAVVDGLAEKFGNLHVAGVVGNHGRLTRKPRAKLRVRDNWEWLLYRLLAREFKDNDSITFQIPESADCVVPIFDTTFRLTHGDQFRGGSGIAGMLSPLLLGNHRKSKRQSSLHSPYDWLVMGHWHEYWSGKGIIVNGSLKGYDEYAYQSNFSFERPQQAFWVVAPKQGIILSAPIFAEDQAK